MRRLAVVTPSLSLFAFAELINELSSLDRTRLVIPPDSTDLALLGSAGGRPVRNRLQSRWLAALLARWLDKPAEVRYAAGGVPQGAFVVRDVAGQTLHALLGSLSFSSEGLGLAPGNPLSLIQASETSEEAELLSQWFDVQRSLLSTESSAKEPLIVALRVIAARRQPYLIYSLVLHHHAQAA